MNSPHRLTVEAHEGFRASITPPAPDPFDLIDELAAAELDLQPRSHREADRVLRLLDEIEAGRVAR